MARILVGCSQPHPSPPFALRVDTDHTTRKAGLSDADVALWAFLLVAPEGGRAAGQEICALTSRLVGMAAYACIQEHPATLDACDIALHHPTPPRDMALVRRGAAPLCMRPNLLGLRQARLDHPTDVPALLRPDIYLPSHSYQEGNGPVQDPHAFCADGLFRAAVLAGMLEGLQTNPGPFTLPDMDAMAAVLTLAHVRRCAHTATTPLDAPIDGPQAIAGLFLHDLLDRASPFTPHLASLGARFAPWVSNMPAGWCAIGRHCAHLLAGLTPETAKLVARWGVGEAPTPAPSGHQAMRARHAMHAITSLLDTFPHDQMVYGTHGPASP